MSRGEQVDKVLNRHVGFVVRQFDLGGWCGRVRGPVMKERVGQWTAHALLEQNEHGGHFDAFVGQSAGQATSAVVVLAGGCFWGVQVVFQHVKGVTNAVSGYAGGDKKTAEYETVSGGRTGHAESVQVTYDPRQISYGRLLQIFFSEDRGS